MLAEGSQKINEMLKQVQHDKNFGSLCKVLNDSNTFSRPLERGIKGEGQGCNKTVSEAHSKFLVPYCLSNLVSSKKPAFTLAEVLITLGIIGIVAAMTIPTLISNYKEKELVTKAKKALSQINNAVDMARAENSYGDNSILFNSNSSTDEVMKAFAKYFKVQEICVASDSGCGGYYSIKAAKPFSGDGETYSSATTTSWRPRFLTMDGVLICVQKLIDGCEQIMTNTKFDENGMPVKDEQGNIVTYDSLTHACASILVDTNGKSEPNQLGRDAFKLIIDRDKIRSDYTIWGGDMHGVVRTGKLYDTVDYTIGGAVED